MNFPENFLVAALIIVLNLIIYRIFKKYLYAKPDSAMKFLVINIAKDILWLAFSLIILEPTKANFLFILLCFIIASFFIYFSVIKLINRS